MKRWYGRLMVGLGAISIAVLIIMLILPKPPIPPKIKRQLTFTFLAPGGQYPIDHNSIKYDPKLKLLTFNITANGTSMIVSEQPTPDAFTDVPQVYDKLVAGMLEYSNFDVDVGSVHLTRPTELQGKQAAVLNTKGTLLFAKPATNLSDDQWRRLFNSFTVVQ